MGMITLAAWVSFVVCGPAAGRPVAVANGGDPAPSVTWKKTVIEARFRSEGVSVGDVNHDGKADILVGDCWYEAPSWTRHDIRQPGEFGDGLHSYSKCMTCWADDINGDGWVDEVVVGFPGDAAYWYENPRGQPGHWPEHEIWHSACNETPLYTDLFKDGRRVLIMGWQPKGKDNEGQMAWFAPGTDPTRPWPMHPISEPSSPGKPMPGTFRFSHGLGAGDLNGDGRKDVICTDGWWEQPASGRSATAAWPFHPGKFGDAVSNILAYDVNRDGKPDAIASSAHQYGIWWFEQGDAASSAFEKHDLFPDLVSETHALIAADINGDGLDDLVTGKRFWSHGKNEPGSDKPARLYWFEASRKGDGPVAFTPREIDDQSGIGTQFVVEDFNGDGTLDIVVSNKKGTYLFEQIKRTAP
ncbi:FG-GAP repeat domain-containing protein [Aquisphaera insulae]|uniref:FG-GAP repeat domain-containing protein n=1 Tax=Aquisphaera insulae TaxID=2712864 RepID=UPI00202FFB72|nr:FG-GAP-like repeat-containing protein [Aquisphaera insulae]